MFFNWIRQENMHLLSCPIKKRSFESCVSLKYLDVVCFQVRREKLLMHRLSSCLIVVIIIIV